MAAAQAQMQGMVSNQQDQTTVKWAQAKMFGDVPSESGSLKLRKLLDWLHGITSGGSKEVG